MLIKTDGLIKRGERIAVALSGGADSVALFHALCALEKELGIEVLAINVEHGIRGASSVSDSDFVKKLCENMGKRLLFYKVDAPKHAEDNKMGLEVSARELRYNCFFSSIEKGLCDKVATAHHLGDNTESILLNAFRGSGAKGLKGIGEKAFSDRIIRPMLSVSKEQITAYIAQNHLDFVTDNSNFEDSYSRNYLRLNVIPIIKERFPDVENALLRLSGIVKDDDDYLYSLATPLVNIENGEAKISLANTAKPVFSRGVMLAMQGVGLTKDYERAHVEAVMALEANQVGAKLSLPHGFIAERSYDGIVIYKEEEHDLPEYKFSEGVFAFPKGVLTIRKIKRPNEIKTQKTAFFTQNQAKGVLFMTLDIPENTVIRCRAEGDEITKFGGGTKSLKEYLIDKKIERRYRNGLPVIASGSKILLVAGVDISEQVAVKDGDSEIYKIEYEREE